MNADAKPLKTVREKRTKMPGAFWTHAVRPGGWLILPGAKLNSRSMAGPQGELQEVIRNSGLHVVKHANKTIVIICFFHVPGIFSELSIYFYPRSSAFICGRN